MGKDYVLKHIKLKHTEKMEAQRSKVLFQPVHSASLLICSLHERGMICMWVTHSTL